MEGDLESWVSAIRSYVMASKTRLTLDQIKCHMKTLKGTDIPYEKYKFSSLEELVKNIPGLNVFATRHQIYVQFISGEKIQRISKLMCLHKIKNEHNKIKSNTIKRVQTNKGNESQSKGQRKMTIKKEPELAVEDTDLGIQQRNKKRRCGLVSPVLKTKINSQTKENVKPRTRASTNYSNCKNMSNKTNQNNSTSKKKVTVKKEPNMSITDSESNEMNLQKRCLRSNHKIMVTENLDQKIITRKQGNSTNNLNKINQTRSVTKKVDINKEPRSPQAATNSDNRQIETQNRSTFTEQPSNSNTEITSLNLALQSAQLNLTQSQIISKLMFQLVSQSIQLNTVLQANYLNSNRNQASMSATYALQDPGIVTVQMQRPNFTENHSNSITRAINLTSPASFSVNILPLQSDHTSHNNEQLVVATTKTNKWHKKNHRSHNYEPYSSRDNYWHYMPQSWIKKLRKYISLKIANEKNQFNSFHSLLHDPCHQLYAHAKLENVFLYYTTSMSKSGYCYSTVTVGSRVFKSFPKKALSFGQARKLAAIEAIKIISYEESLCIAYDRHHYYRH